jgi:hemoglobin
MVDPLCPRAWPVRLVGGYPSPAYSQDVQLGRKSEETAYERWGGAPFFVALVDRFYAGVATDPLLRPLYPDDLTGPKAHLALFFMQYWGGPRHYSDQRGHPRLRMRHAPFAIGPAQAQAWLGHMAAAVHEAGLPPADETELLDYLTMAAHSLINTAV